MNKDVEAKFEEIEKRIENIEEWLRKFILENGGKVYES